MADCGIITLEEEEEDEEETNKQTNTDDGEGLDAKDLEEHSVLDDLRRIGREKLADQMMQLEKLRRSLGELHKTEASQSLKGAAGEESESVIEPPILNQRDYIEIGDEKIGDVEDIKQITNDRQSLSKDVNEAENIKQITDASQTSRSRENIGIVMDYVGEANKQTNQQSNQQTNQQSNISIKSIENKNAKKDLTPIIDSSKANQEGKRQNEKRDENQNQINLNEIANENENLFERTQPIATMDASGSLMTRGRWRGMLEEEVGRYKDVNSTNLINNNAKDAINKNYNSGGRRICYWHNFGFCR